MATISVIVPTIDGREDHLARCLGAYAGRSVNDVELIVERSHPTCGPAWNAGAKRATGDYLHFTADDLEPLDDWDALVVQYCKAKLIPAPSAVIDVTDESQSRYLEDGQGVSGYGADIDVVPFCSRTQWEAIGEFLPCHYFTDSYFSRRALAKGFVIVGCRGYAFRHHVAAVGRGAGMSAEERMKHDYAIFQHACANP
jgi:hypothetical protein